MKAGFNRGDTQAVDAADAVRLKALYANEFADVLHAVAPLEATGIALSTEIAFKLHGLSLKPIDIGDPGRAEHSRMERVEKSVFGDT